ncbi:MAG: VCBS repeat-containing protein, partial [Armatimonadota bacterium]
TAYSNTLQCADLDGDGADELIGRGIDGISVWKYRPASSSVDGSWDQIQFDNDGPAWSNSNGWLNPGYSETIQCARISSGVEKILLGRGRNGMEAWRFRISPGAKSGTWTQLATIDALSDAANCNVPEYYETIQCADIDGDGRDELLIRGSAGVYVWKYGGGDGQTDSWTSGPLNEDLPDSANWNQPKYYQTIQLADIDGDGRAELIARAGAGIQIWSYDTDDLGSSSWSERQSGPAWADGSNGDKGWDAVEYYSSIQTARALKPGDVGYTGDGSHTQSVLLARGPGWVETWRLDRKPGEQGTWYQTSVPYQTLTGGPLAAYEGITRLLRLSGTGVNGIRERYGDSAADFDRWISELSGATRVPGGVSATQDEWDAVRNQIINELYWVKDVQNWYGNLMARQITDTFLAEDLTLFTVGPYLQFDNSNNTTLILSILALVAGAIVAVLGFPVLELGAAAAVAGVIGTAFSAAALGLPGGGTDLFQAPYNQLQGQLRDSFSNALEANGANLRAITGTVNGSTYVPGDYGLLSAIGQMIDSSVWDYEDSKLPATVLVAQRAYAVSIWKTLLVAVQNSGSKWQVNINNNGDNLFDFPRNFVPEVSVYKGGRPDGNGGTFRGWEWITQGGDQGWIDQSHLIALFGPVDPQKPNVFPLGVPTAEVYLSQNGWPAMNGQLTLAESVGAWVLCDEAYRWL